MHRLESISWKRVYFDEGLEHVTGKINNINLLPDSRRDYYETRIGKLLGSLSDEVEAAEAKEEILKAKKRQQEARQRLSELSKKK